MHGFVTPNFIHGADTNQEHTVTHREKEFDSYIIK